MSWRERAELGADTRAVLDRYLGELERWGARVNLVGSTDRRALDLHLEDALAGAAALPAGGRVVDLGSGAGLPGIPLAVARPDVHFVLVEIRERRVHFLRHVVRTLGLGCEVWRRRIEEPPAEGFDRVLARAVAPPREILASGRPWLAESGECWIWTREDAAACGVAEASVLPIGSDGSRGHILRVPARAIPRGTGAAG